MTDRAATLAGLAEVIAGHEDFDYDDDRNAWFCECGERIAGPGDRQIGYAAHVAAVALAWLEGHGWAEGAPVYPLIRDLADPDDCWFDHHGGCQAHGYLDLKPGEICPQREAKDWLAAHAPVETGDQK